MAQYMNTVNCSITVQFTNIQFYQKLYAGVHHMLANMYAFIFHPRPECLPAIIKLICHHHNHVQLTNY